MSSTAAAITRKPGQHGAVVDSRRTLRAVKRILIEKAFAGDPHACAEVLRLAAERRIRDDDLDEDRDAAEG
jgi:predicted dehydrogenase